MDEDRILREAGVTRGFTRLARIYRREINHALAEHGLSDAKAMPVLHVSRLGEGVRQGVLAEDMGLEGPSLVRLLDQLCAAGLMERRDDPADGRAKLLHLTDDGRAMVAIIEDALQQLRSRLLRGVSDADLEAAIRVFDALETATGAGPA